MTELGLWVLWQAKLGFQGLEANAQLNDDNEVTKDCASRLKQVAKGRRYLSKSRNVKGVMEMAKIVCDDPVVHTLMDADPNVLGTPSGVLDLRTGSLLSGRPYVSMMVGAQWTGLDTDTARWSASFLTS